MRTVIWGLIRHPKKIIDVIYDIDCNEVEDLFQLTIFTDSLTKLYLS